MFNISELITIAEAIHAVPHRLIDSIQRDTILEKIDLELRELTKDIPTFVEDSEQLPEEGWDDWGMNNPT